MTNTEKPIILWFRQDLRLEDNPALDATVKTGRPIVPLYILDDETRGPWKWGGASRWWLHHSLKALNKALKGKLILKVGRAETVLKALSAELKTDTVYWNRCYAPFAIARDKKIKSLFKGAESFKAALLHEPWEVQNKQGNPYKVYTPYSKACFDKGDPPPVLQTPKKINLCDKITSLELDDLSLLPEIPWDKGFYDVWQPGEAGAHSALETFLEDGIHGYETGRDLPAQENVSRLSPHLHWGEISPRQIWHAVLAREAAQEIKPADALKFKKEILWREFSHSLLYHFPALPEKPLDARFTKFPWKKNKKHLKAWQTGQTGYPIIDAGMRQLWQTGWMHNRVRMIVASFLIKNLLIDWRDGQAWFWDTLVDADIANNTAGWQWVAGCGADASPFFRIFNPVTQGEKFDGQGDYVRQFVPEIAGLSDKYIHKPWDAPNDLLEKAGVTLGKTYPKPIVDLATTRQRALDAFAEIKNL